jgi:hypothetical protein
MRKCSVCAAVQSAEKTLYAYTLNDARKIACVACLAAIPTAKVKGKIPDSYYNVTGANPSGE